MLAVARAHRAAQIADAVDEAAGERHAAGQHIAGEEALVGRVDLAGAPPPHLVLKALMDVALQGHDPFDIGRVLWQKRVEQRNYLARKYTLDYDDVMNMQREVVYTWRNEVIDTEDPRSEIYEVIDEAVPAKLKEYLDVDEPKYGGLIHWVNTTFPLGLSMDSS